MFINPSNSWRTLQATFSSWTSDNYLVRKITPDGTVSTFVGGGSGSLPGYGTSISLSASGVTSTSDQWQLTIRTPSGFPA